MLLSKELEQVLERLKGEGYTASPHDLLVVEMAHVDVVNTEQDLNLPATHLSVTA